MKHPKIFLAGLLSLGLIGCKPKPPLVTSEDVRNTIRADVFTLTAASRFEQDAVNAPTEAERLTARVLLVETWLQPQGPLTMKEVQGELKKLIADASDSWQGQVARLQIMRAYDVNTDTEEMIAIANDSLVNARFDLLNSPHDPLLVAYLATIDYRLKDMREFFIFMRGSCYATAMNLEKLRSDFDLLPAGELKTQLGYRMKDIEAMAPEQRARHRQMLIDTVRNAEQQERKDGRAK